MVPPVPILLGTIPKAIDIALWIYNHGIRKADAPDAQYHQFFTDIHELEKSLEAIRNVVNTAYGYRKEPAAPGPRHGLSLDSLDNIVGDFNATLLQCKFFLSDNRRFEKDADGFIRKIQWNALLADQMESLRRRVVFHNIRLIQILKPLELTMYSNLQADVKDGFAHLTKEIRDLKGVFLKDVIKDTEEAEAPLPELPIVDDYLSLRFGIAAKLPDMVVDDDIALSSLFGHFEAGTVKFRPSSPISSSPHPQQYVNLMKCVWIMHQWKFSPNFQSQENPALKTSMIRDLERNILEEIKRFDSQAGDLRMPFHQEIEILPQESYKIWIFQEPLCPLPTLNEPAPSEIKIFERSLVDPSKTQTQGLVVFTTPDEPHILRIITTVASKIERNVREQPYQVDAEKVQLLPTYAEPGAVVFNLQMKTSPTDRQSLAFSFRSQEDLHCFQQCITGFEVKFQQPGLTSVVYKKGQLSQLKTAGNAGVLQIWNHNSLLRNDMSSSVSTIRPQPFLPTDRWTHHGSQVTSAEDTPTGSSGKSKRRSLTRSNESAPRPISLWQKQHVPSVRLSTTQPYGGGFSLDFPEAPLVVMLLAETKQEQYGQQQKSVTKALRFLTFPLDEFIRIDLSKCKCHESYEQCTRVVIVSMRCLDAKLYDFGGEGNRNEWNIAALRRPRHDEQKKNLQKLNDIMRITINFGNVSDKIAFRDCMMKVADNYKGLCDEYRQAKSKLLGNDMIDPHAR